jgi:hypothetical protein
MSSMVNHMIDSFFISSQRQPSRLNVVYTCTEDIEENDQILAYKIQSDGSLTQIGSVDAGGTSAANSFFDVIDNSLFVG